MELKYKAVTLTSETILDHIDHQDLNEFVGRIHSGRTLMAETLAFLTAEALFDQNVLIGEQPPTAYPVLVDDELHNTAIDRKWRGFALMGLKQGKAVLESKGHHGFTPAQKCLTLNAPFFDVARYPVHAVSAVWENTLNMALAHYKYAEIKKPMFLANHRWHKDRLVEYRSKLFFCSLHHIPTGMGNYLKAYLGVGQNKHGETIVFGFSFERAGDTERTKLIPLTAKELEGLISFDSLSGQIGHRLVDHINHFVPAEERVQ